MPGYWGKLLKNERKVDSEIGNFIAGIGKKPNAVHENDNKVFESGK